MGDEEKVPQQGEESESPALNLDDMFNASVDEGDVQQTLSDTLLDAGWWRSVPPGNVNKREYEGRAIAGIFLPLAKAPKKGEPFNPPEMGLKRFRLEVSPNRRNKMLRDESGKATLDSGEPDNRSILWAQAYKAFQAAAGRKPESGAEVLQYLSEQPILIRLIQVGVPSERNPNPDGEPRNICMGIAAVRE